MTKSSMCRTQLFPKGDISSPSSPARQLHNRPEMSTSATRVSAHIDPTEGSVPRFKMDESVPRSSSSDLSSSPKRISLYDVSKNRDAFAVPQNRHKLSHHSNSTHHHPLEASLKQDTPLHIQHPHPQPSSSTPLHSELHQPLIPLADSPLTDSKHDQQRWTSQERDRSPSESPDKTELGSFHLSPLSDPLDPPSSSSCRGPQTSRRDDKSCSESQHSGDYSNDDNTGAEAKRSGTRNKEGERETDCETKDMCYEEEQEEGKGGTDVAEPSFQQSFMDEPPIAFSDSWDACIGGNAGCFSLRLEDSGASNQHERSETSRSSSSAERPPPPPSGVIQSLNSCGSATKPSPAKAHSTQPSTSVQAPTPPAPDHNSLLDSKLWDSWEEEEEEEVLPLSQRVNPFAQLKTPKSAYMKKRRSLVPITPMPQYSDMDTPELKNKLNRSTVKFKEPRAPAAISPLKQRGEEEEGELLSASQSSNTSSTAASEESERSNPELCLSSDGNSDSDGGISASQAANRLQDRLQAVRSFILSDPRLYNQILQYQPLVLSQLQERLKAAGIRLGAAKLVDYLDSQCITFTTAKPGQPAPSRKRGHRTGRGQRQQILETDSASLHSCDSFTDEASTQCFLSWLQASTSHDRSEPLSRAVSFRRGCTVVALPVEAHLKEAQHSCSFKGPQPDRWGPPRHLLRSPAVTRGHERQGDVEEHRAARYRRRTRRQTARSHGGKVVSDNGRSVVT
ncbi:hypothetical protein INR49_015363 [Caranx melampygus]|nr:hypothetical protein INR49_015363 [Caranx melampygus]